MHCGPVRHKIPSETDLVQELHVHPTATTIREDIDSETPGILQSIIIPALVSDRTRTAQIVDDIVRAIRRGRNCLVMAGRTEHVDLLAAEITSRGLAPMVLHGSVSPGQRRAILRQLADWDPARTREPLLLAATASYIGEGFDCPALDTLFLCSPSSSESIITQNVGRIMRELPGKTTAEVMSRMPASWAGEGCWCSTSRPSRTPMAGSRAIKVPNAAGLMLRSASISRAYGKTGSSRASPAAAARTPAVRCPAACGMPGSAAVAAAMGTVSESPWMPVKRSLIRWVSRM
jgi:hypothetical protein